LEIVSASFLYVLREAKEDDIVRNRKKPAKTIESFERLIPLPFPNSIITHWNRRNEVVLCFY
jgi:hypothetical protein